MSLKDYTNERRLIECVISYYYLRLDVELHGQARKFNADQYIRLKAEVLERMGK